MSGVAHVKTAQRDDWGTPREEFAAWHKRFGFTLDVCAAPYNAKLPRYFGEGGLAQDGLAMSWAGERWFCNPPFSKIKRWLDKAWNEMNPNLSAISPLGVMLLPASRTEQKWWHELVEPYRDGRTDLGPVKFWTEFVEGRTHYEPPPGVKASTPTFGSVLLIWERTGLIQ